jgi:hypothetical protein
MKCKVLYFFTPCEYLNGGRRQPSVFLSVLWCRWPVFVVQVSQGSGAPPQDETSNEGLVVDVDSPAASQSKYSPLVSSCVLRVYVCVCVDLYSTWDSCFERGNWACRPAWNAFPCRCAYINSGVHRSYKNLGAGPKF